MNKQMNRHGRTPTFADFSRLAGALANAEEDSTHEAFFQNGRWGPFSSPPTVCALLC